MHKLKKKEKRKTKRCKTKAKLKLKKLNSNPKLHISQQYISGCFLTFRKFISNQNRHLIAEKKRERKKLATTATAMSERSKFNFQKSSPYLWKYNKKENLVEKNCN